MEELVKMKNETQNANGHSNIRPFDYSTNSHSTIRTFKHSIISSRPAFTLVEMLVVVGILAVLIGASLSAFTSTTKKAQKAKGQELVHNVATALEKIYQEEGAWPRRILNGSNSENGLDERVAYALAKRNALSLSYDDSSKKTTALDQCGVVSPWAQDVIRRKKGQGVSESTKVPSGGTIKTHRLRYAVDTDGRGFVTANVEGESVIIRGSVAVWCAGYDGKLEKYKDGLRKDDIYSWSRNQVKE